MLTEQDLIDIRANRAEITRNRLEEITLHKRVAAEEDEFTGDITYTDTETIVLATWSTLYSQSGGEGEINLDDGVLVITDDAIIEMDLSVNIDGLSEVTRNMTGERYVVKAKDIVGLGVPNRHYILLELVK